MKSKETATGGCFRQWLLPFLMVAVLLPQISVGAAQDEDEPSSEQWIAIDAYNEAMQAYWTKQSEIRNADIPDEERERLRQEFGLPDSAPAVAAALAIMQSDGKRVADVASFLMGRARPSEEQLQSVLDAVASHIGPDWALVEDYIKSQAVFLETYDADIVKRPTWHAVAAARALIDSDHERSLEAAEFLVQQTYAMNPGSRAMMLSLWWLPPSRDLGEATLSKLIGPDWNVVRNHLDELNAWQDEEAAIRESDLDEEDRARRLKDLGEAPNPYRAAVASLAIVDAGGAHEKTLEAAEFLLDHPTRGGAARALRGAETLAAHFPDYDQWPLRLKQVNGLSSAYGPARSFITGLSETLDDPLALATARYFAASYLIQSANNPQLGTDERIAQQEKAEELANGLSAGIEDETFVLAKQSDDGTEVAMTFADAEAELFYSLDSTMVGSVVSDVTGRRVDGTEDTLADYAGRVVLVDFWATWCGPCKDAFPKLRKMVEEFPEDRFQIIGVSVDEELDTVLDYLADEPLGWVVWHVGNESELVRRWRVTGYPTYVLVGPDGTIINKHPGAFNAGFRAEIEQAVQDAGATENDALSSTDPWNVMDAYDATRDADLAKHWEIPSSDILAEEKKRIQQKLYLAEQKERNRRRPRSDLDAAPAIAAAMASLESGGEKLLDAADFLLNRAHPSKEEQRLVLEAIATHFGPDWSLVEDHIQSRTAFLEAARTKERDEAMNRRLQQGVTPPTWHAVAAARAIVASKHARAIEAAEFLSEQRVAMRPESSAVVGSSWWLRPSRVLGETAVESSIGRD